MASPAADGKALYLRTKTHLYRVENMAPETSNPGRRQFDSNRCGSMRVSRTIRSAIVIVQFRFEILLAGP